MKALKLNRNDPYYEVVPITNDGKVVTFDFPKPLKLMAADLQKVLDNPGTEFGYCWLKEKGSDGISR